MPQYGLTDPAFAGTVMLSPYKLGDIKRSAEVVLIFDAPLVMNSSGIWKVWSDTPVANFVDGGRMQSWGNAPKTFLLDNYEGTTLAADTSIEMSARNSGNFDNGPGTSYVNTDSPNNLMTVRFRHMKNTVANALLADGHVESFTYNPKRAPNDPQVTNLLRKNFCVNRQ
jgi:prepilin-type processing-associated H-X9-DG protein